MKNPLSVMVVDDEPPARQFLCELLARHKDVTVVAQADGVPEAERLAAELKPDVLFLDVQMPPWTGFDLLPRLSFVPSIVFVTAHDAFAVRAFEANALDYLLKPVHPERLALTLERLTGVKSGGHEPSPRCLTLDDLVLLRDRAQIKMVPVKQLAVVHAEGAYTRVILCGEESMLVLRAIGEWAKILPTPPFLHADRSVILNQNLVRDIHLASRNEMQVRLEEIKEPLVLGRSAAARLRRVL